MVVRYNNLAARNEKLVSKLLTDKWGVRVEPTLPFSPVDFILYKDDLVVGYVETKARTHNYGTYPTIYLSLRKYEALHKLSMSEHVPTYFVVMFEDQFRYINIDDVDALSPFVAGRTDRRDAPNDMELMLNIPIEHLRLL